MVMNPGGRLAFVGQFPTVANEYPIPDVNSCSGPTSQTYNLVAGIDYMSPDAVFQTYAFGCLFPGADPPGLPSLWIIFDASGATGKLEIDTCCTQGNHLDYEDPGACGGPPFSTPLFQEGVITLTAPPVCNADPNDVNCDGVTDILDVVNIVNVAFRAAAALPPCCK